LRLAALRSRLGLIGRAPSFRLLFVATLASGLGTWLAVIALTVDVFDRTHSAKWVSALLVADFLPTVGIGLLLGPLVDRVSRKLLMIGADVVRFAVFCALPFADSPTRIVVLAAIAGFATGFFRPASLAGVPNLVGPEDLAEANSQLRVVEYLTTTAGTLLGGVLTAVHGPDLAYWLNAATFAVSALFLLRIPARLLQEGKAPTRGHFRDIGDGFRLIGASRTLVLVLVVWGIAIVANSTVNVAEIALAKISFDAGDFGFGLLWTASGIGLVVGSVLAPSWLRSRGMTLVYTGSIALMGIGAVTAAVSPNVWVAVWCVAVGGLGNGGAVVYNSLLVQLGAPDHLRGRVFTTIISFHFALMGIAMAASGPFIDAVGARWAYGSAAGVYGLAAATSFVLSRGGVFERVPEPAVTH
jgi:DHA3 family macrolide efflux protein-like MFS transporter